MIILKEFVKQQVIENHHKKIKKDKRRMNKNRSVLEENG